MRTARPGVLLRFAAVFALLGFGFALPQTLQAQAVLEDPSQESSQSGIALIRGWACQANLIEIQIDNTPRLRAAYSTTREDTRSACGDADNGFGLTWNWNLLGNGVHRVRAFADDAQFADVTFTVTTLGTEFLRGASGAYVLPNFPTTGRNVTVQWQESLQNFVIVGATGTGGGGQVCTPNSTQACTTSQGCPGQKVCNSSGTGFGSCNDTPGDNCPSTGRCDPSYPTVCIPPPPPDLNCGDIPHRNFRVLPPDPHRFDGDGDGIGCET